MRHMSKMKNFMQLVLMQFGALNQHHKVLFLSKDQFLVVEGFKRNILAKLYQGQNLFEGSEKQVKTVSSYRTKVMHFEVIKICNWGRRWLGCCIYFKIQ